VAYLSYYLGSKVPFKKVISGGAVAALGYLAVFVAIGIMPAVLGQMALHYIPVLEVIAGVIVIVFGVVIFSGARFPIHVPSLASSTRSGLSGLFIFGLAFGMATAACSAPIFLAIILLAMTSGGIPDVILTFLVYALGMGVPVVVSGLLVATAREAVLRKLVRMRPLLDKISGALMIIVGVYLIYYYLGTYWF
jgi:cytochrome c-type biogenesis protein